MNSTKPIGRYARILLDSFFKRAFGTEKNKRLTTLFLEELIPERKIINLTFVQTEHINPYPEKMDNRIDIECTDADGSRFLVELQVKRQASIYDRAVLYSTYGIQAQLEKGADDYFFPTVYFIGLLDFSMHKDTDEVKFRYLLKRDVGDEVMTDHLQYIFLELPNCKKALTKEASVLDNVCYALHNMEHLTDRPAELKEEIFKLLFECAEISNFTAEEKVKYEQDMTTERDRRNQLRYAVDNAREEGREEGRSAGLEEGRKEGRKEGAVEIAKALLANDVKMEVIVASTGLSEEEIGAPK